MSINLITDLIESWAPLDSQEPWDCSGWVVEIQKEAKKILLSLSVTQEIVDYAYLNGFDMIISHHPLFFVPFSSNKGIPIYCAHTNLDKAKGGTTDTLVEKLGLDLIKSSEVGEFLRIVDLKNEIMLSDFLNLLREKLSLKNISYSNNKGLEKFSKIAFCAGSGTDFAQEAKENGAQVLVTGDLKYHVALDSDIIIIDAGHFSTEVPVLQKLKQKLEALNFEVVVADEKNPIITL